MIYDDYETYLATYSKLYGEKTIVLLECGSFYELYDDGTRQTNLREIGDLLGIQVSRRNKSIVEVSRGNLEMAGFPSYALNKFLNILTRNNYTVVVVSQTTPPPNPKREVTHIVSPGTYIEDDTLVETNYLMCLYLEKHIDFKTKMPTLAVGASLIDLGTGKTHCMETVSRANDIQYPLDELYRICVAFSPREVIVCSSQETATDIVTYEQIIRHLDLEDKCHHNNTFDFDKNITKASYQEELLKRVFTGSQRGLLSCIEYVGLENLPCARVSYVRMLQFIHNHNERVLVKVAPPSIIQEANTLILSYNSIKQLDILSSTHNASQSTISKNHSQSLFDILNNCKTAVGRRYFKERIMSPLRNPKQLQSCYDSIQYLLDDNRFRNVREILMDVYDMERLFRRVDLGTIHPCELWNIHQSCYNLGKAMDIACGTLYFKTHYHMTSNISTHLEDISACITNTCLLEELPKYNQDNISACIFKKGFNERLDNLYEDHMYIKGFFDECVTELNKLHQNKQNTSDTLFKLECNERDGYYLLITSKRFQEFSKAHAKSSITIGDNVIEVSSLTSKSVSSSSASVKVSHALLSKNNDTLDIIGLKLKKCVVDVYKQYLKTLSDTTSQYAATICQALAEIDYTTCCAYNAFTYKYTMPVIKDSYDSKSYIKAQSLRHPIIERISTETCYVSNDISLGIPEEQDGILLYGLNSSGKSSLMKSIGISIVMAQSGMFVPCDAMEFWPYDYIFTRILSCDDIFKGQSTFTKEMLELRGILKRSNKNSLVLGDELCSGTESISALSIVSAGIQTLAKRECSFVFATHLHDLVNIENVKTLNNVRVYHLSVEYDNQSKRLIYDRKLKEGNGSTLYGLEVCKSLDLDAEFLQLANSVRHKLLDTHENILSTTSNHNKYNKRVYVDKCQVCGDKASEIHHIAQQKDADSNGYIGTFHKNEKFNLVSLCEACHDQVHHGNLVIKGYKLTSEGVVLDFHETFAESSSTMKIPIASTEVSTLEQEIQNLMSKTPRLKKVEAVKILQTKFKDISKYKIEKSLKMLLATT